MVIWQIIVCMVFAIIIGILSLKLALIRKGIEEIRSGFAEKLESDTNTLISISTREKTVSCLASDINRQLRQLREQRHRFVQGDLELKNAVTNISHDLRTPLTAISGYLDLLDQTEKSQTASRYIEIIKERTQLLKQLTEELFRYSVISSPDWTAEAEPVNVNAVLEESVAGFYAALRERSITPEIHMTEKKIIRQLNQAALSRVFSNLMSNAIKYSDGDLEISLTDTGQILFSNTAYDLSQVEAQRLFERFYTVESARKSTGLGLSIAKILVEQMGGNMSARYESDRLMIEVQLPNQRQNEQK
ncbi:MAG: HAMP domain-containing histidine kinase [Firmicutes bacterium]|nr:HAMP domain-containing histidine kinase [Bacillota bacterium]